MSEVKKLAKECFIFKQGQENLLGENDSVEDGIEKSGVRSLTLPTLKIFTFCWELEQVLTQYQQWYHF